MCHSMSSVRLTHTDASCCLVSGVRPAESSEVETAVAPQMASFDAAVVFEAVVDTEAAVGTEAAAEMSCVRQTSQSLAKHKA